MDLKGIEKQITETRHWNELMSVFLGVFGLTQMEYDGSKKRTDYVDVGEKIGGARKDLWTPGSRRFELSDMEGLDSGQALKLVTKKNVMEGVFESVIDNGPDPAAAWMMDKVFKSISPKPGDTDDERRGFVSAIEDVQEAFSNVKTIDDLKNVLLHIQDEIKGYSLSPDEFDLKNRYDSASKKWNEVRQAKWKSIYQDKKWYKGARFMSYEASMALREWEKTEKEKYLPKDLAQEFYEARRGWDAREDENPKSKRNQYKSLGKRFVDAVTFKSKAFVDNFNKAGRTISDMSWLEKDTKKKRGKVQKPKWSRYIPEDVERSGGKNQVFKPKDLLSTFKIRGVEYGNWMDEESSQHHTQMLGESFLDLSDILGIPLEHISYGGRLAIAFGARGSGSASAHYEPAKKAINMTKFNGGGSLAHEWSHFLDNVVSMLSTDGKQKHGMCSDGKIGGSVPTEIGDIYKEFNDAIENGDVRPDKSEKLPEGSKPFWPFYGKAPTADEPDPQAIMDNLSDTTRSKYSRKKGRYTAPAYNKKTLKQAADYIHTVTGKPVTYGKGESKFMVSSKNMTGGGKGYWVRKHEMFARAFEAYIKKKMTSRGAKNTYLVSGAFNMQDAPYPQGKELEKIEGIFDRLITSLKENQILESAMALEAMLEREDDEFVSVLG